MLSRFGFTRRRDVDNALAELEHWATQNWRDQWAIADQTDLQAALDRFLPDAMDHAHGIEDLQNVYSARITRTLLMGITHSQTHDTAELEAALGVPMPKGAIR